MNATRLETDSLGTREVPASSYWGIHTLRAVENFPSTGRRLHPGLIAALGDVKKACAMTNAELGFLDDAKAAAIITACDEVASGRWNDEFPVDALQGGAGTSTNMNANEVIANRASEILGGGRGDESLVHPIADVNLHQSTNDVCPTALRVAAIRRIRLLAEAVARLQGALQRKEQEFAAIVKMGRTELQEAVPMTLGMEFSAWAEAAGRDRWRTFKCEERLRVVNLGGTAIGTGITAPTDYIFLVADRLREITGLPLARAENLVGATSSSDVLVEVSGILKTHAANLLKLSNDLRLLGLLGEIRLPALQAGSSIMPGKINPVLMEMTSQVALKVMANDFLVSEAASRSHLQISEFLPLAADSLLDSIDLLIAIDQRLAPHVDAITADPERCLGYVTGGVTLVTALVPKIGYPAAAAVAREFQSMAAAGGGVGSFVQLLEERYGREVAESVIDPSRVAMLGFRTPAEAS
jgi:aspartate ammonia-lyase